MIPSGAQVTLVVEKNAAETKAFTAVCKAIGSKATVTEVAAGGATLGADAVPRLQIAGSTEVISQPVTIMRALVEQAKAKLFAPDGSDQTLAKVEGLLEWATRNMTALQGPASKFTAACFDYLEDTLSKSSGAYLTGDEVSAADILIACVLESCVQPREVGTQLRLI